MKRILRILLSTLIITFATTLPLVAGGCWFSQLLDDIASPKNTELKNFIKDNDDGFAAYEVVYNALGETAIQRTDVALLKKVSELLDDSKFLESVKDQKGLEAYIRNNVNELKATNGGGGNLSTTLDDANAANVVGAGTGAAKIEQYSIISNKINDISLDGYLMGRYVNGKLEVLGSTNISQKWDYIVNTKGEVLVGRKHSWLSKGEDVIAAGELKFNNGKLVGINNASGHYRPTPDEASNFLKIFESLDINI